MPPRPSAGRRRRFPLPRGGRGRLRQVPPPGSVAGSQGIRGLAGHDSRASSFRQIVHREEEEVGRAQQRHRLVVRQVAVSGHEVEAGHPAVGLGQDPGEVHLELAPEIGPAVEQPLHRPKEVDVGAGSGVEPLDGAAEEQADVIARLCLLADVHEPRMDDAEAVARLGRGAAVESSASKPFGIVKTGLPASSGTLRRTSAVASGVFMITASAFASAERIRRSSSRGGFGSGRRASRRAPRDRAGRRSTACRAPRRAWPRPRRSRTATSTRR